MNIPYRSFSIGQSVSPIGDLQSRVNGYYQASNGKLIIEDVDEFTYRVRPVGQRDVLDAAHFDLVPINVEPTRFFAPANRVKPGVTVRPVTESKTRVISECFGNKAYFMGGGCLSNEPVEIYKMIGDPDDMFFFLREEDEDNN